MLHDEVAPDAGRISWVSPLGRELIGLAAGDTLTWQRGRELLMLEVLGFEYA
ncbi:MAG: GreA/GreB family elongation factor [Gammaproteobacteria bacterium]|nr:GreA/GreB family elongation factor [Gammaproteobacteria bacterium]